jgi:hypothetical protein
MVPPSEDDRDAIDRAFAELVAGYHMTADRPDPFNPETADEPTVITPSADLGDSTADWAAGHPLFGIADMQDGTAPTPSEQSVEDRYVPEPLPPLGRPGVPALLAWIGIGYAIVVVLAATFGVRFSAWAGWVAVGSFVGGFGILMTRLPRQRPPGAGDGAVL